MVEGNQARDQGMYYPCQQIISREILLVCGHKGVQQNGSCKSVTGGLSDI